MSMSIPTQENDWFTHKRIEILNGPWAGFKGEIYYVNLEQKKVWVKVNFLGKDTSVKLNINQIKPLNQE